MVEEAGCFPFADPRMEKGTLLAQQKAGGLKMRSSALVHRKKAQGGLVLPLWAWGGVR